MSGKRNISEIYGLFGITLAKRCLIPVALLRVSLIIFADDTSESRIYWGESNTTCLCTRRVFNRFNVWWPGSKSFWDPRSSDASGIRLVARSTASPRFYASRRALTLKHIRLRPTPRAIATATQPVVAMPATRRCPLRGRYTLIRCPWVLLYTRRRRRLLVSQQNNIVFRTPDVYRYNRNAVTGFVFNPADTGFDKIQRKKKKNCMFCFDTLFRCWSRGKIRNLQRSRIRISSEFQNFKFDIHC